VNPALEQVEIGPLDQIRSLRRLFGIQTGISSAPLAALAAHAITVRIPAGTELHSPEEPVRDVYLIIDGEIAAQYGSAYRAYGPQSAIGVLASIARVNNGFHSWALRDTLALSLRVEDMLEVYEDHFELMYAALRSLSRDGIELRKQMKPHAGFSNVVPVGVVCPTRPLDLVERILALRHTFGLGHSHVDELAELARSSNEVRYPAGTSLWTVDAPAETMLLVICGSIRGSTRDGLSFQLGAGDIVGGLGMVAELPRWFSATVQEPVVALSMEREVLIDLLEDQPELAFDFLQLMATALIALREQAAVESMQTSPQASAELAGTV
jgi:CRP-like cAMP-binding protein